MSIVCAQESDSVFGAEQLWPCCAQVSNVVVVQAQVQPQTAGLKGFVSPHLNGHPFAELTVIFYPRGILNSVEVLSAFISNEVSKTSP